MSRYKEIIAERGLKHKDIVATLNKSNPNIDKPLFSKFVNDVCLPNIKTAEDICNLLQCGIFDLYDLEEIDLPILGTKKKNPSTRGIRGNLSHGEHVYNLTVTIPREINRRLFSKKSLELFGYLNKSEMVRAMLDAKMAELEVLEAKEKATQDNIVESGINPQD